MSDRKEPAQAEVQGEKLYAVQTVRTGAGIHAPFRPLQNLFSRNGSTGSYSRGSEIELVGLHGHTPNSKGNAAC